MLEPITPKRRREDHQRHDDEEGVPSLDIWKAIAKYGLPTALLVPLLYFLVVEARANQQDITERQLTIIREQHVLADAVLKLSDRIGEQLMLSEKVLLVLRVSCVNTATTPNDRNQCLREH